MEIEDSIEPRKPFVFSVYSLFMRPISKLIDQRLFREPGILSVLVIFHPFVVLSLYAIFSKSVGPLGVLSSIDYEIVNGQPN
ncbi:MAG: hypothetical protein B6D73_17265 [gamma proteobacterium symbiont of Stewartia floridana]|nr:MAG: hypothetical protein B6D73_17265 [gamma proteobacterium symbiont of Stewartia floridana]